MQNIRETEEIVREVREVGLSNPGRFAPITCSPRVVSPRKVSRFAPLNRYYVICELKRALYGIKCVLRIF